MKKLISLVLLVLATSFLSCSLVTPTTLPVETTIPTITTTTATTTESVEQKIQNEFTFLESFIPDEITQDFNLPNPQNTDIVVRYFQDGELLEENLFFYVPGLTETINQLTIELTLNGTTQTMVFPIYIVENETLYNQMIIEQTFTEIDALLDELIPEEMVSDIPVPNIEYEGVYIDIDTEDLDIFNHQYIFPYPSEDTLITLTSTIRFKGITKINHYDIMLRGFDNLPQIPQIHITTVYNEEITSNEDYVNASLSLVAFDQNQTSIPLLSNRNVRIRLRGNSTLHMPKKSFKLKFENKTSMLFDYQEYDWVLLANFSDQTLIRNTLANNLSASLNMDFTPSSAFVDVYLNEEFLGNYLLTDQIEVTNDRVDIEEHSYDTDTGFLLEMDKRLLDPYEEGIAGVDFLLIFGYPYALKTPKTDSIYFSRDQFYFIEDYIAQVHTKFMNQQDYSSLIDERSFIDWFIVQEVFQNVDSGFSSVFMHKDKGGVLKMGPIWDFDLSTGNPGHLSDDLRQPEGWYTSLQYKNIWYYYLMQNDGFRAHLKSRWLEIYDHQIQDLIESIYPIANSISKSRYENFIRWDVIGSWEDWYTAPEVLAADTYQKQVQFLYDFLRTRTIWLNEEISDF